MGVDRCVCHNISFARLKEETGRVGCDLGALAAATGCATNCGMCKPYIMLMLETGQTVFPVLSPSAVMQVMDKWTTVHPDWIDLGRRMK